MPTSRPRWPLFTFAIGGSVLLRILLLDFESEDYRLFLSTWCDYFVEHGRLAAFKDDFSRYPWVYLYFVSLSTWLPLPKLYGIKLLSILCDYSAAWFALRALRCRFQRGPIPWFGAILVLYLPTVWLNSAVWAQCDVMFTTALLASLYYVLVKRTAAAMVAFGLACALKPQGVYFVPFLAGWFFRERLHWKYVAIPPLIYAVCGLPAILAGKPLWDVLFRWAQHRNAPQIRELTLGATNWYQWISKDYYEIFLMPGIVLAVVATVFLILALQEQPYVDRSRLYVTAALLSALIVPYFLPGMHERYFYPADLLSLVYAFFVARGWILAVLVQFCSFFTYLPYLFKEEPVPRPLLALVMTFALGMVIRDFGKLMFKPVGGPEQGKGDQ